ncbi:SAM-dependent methyltransferase [Methylocucumis oryzae]|uniref:Methyltransferase type 11 domain-containing protein n=1 Tax=Methylocucumis oryzae TaxID=1632867 RepID=A0A0F3ILV4_9GAMM|nr:methyltransferase domain-containing protein [Methylocucumis oryzae]KJV07740.1 hypothetical protein VZ94_02815 [Methylocucumis oryzae]
MQRSHSVAKRYDSPEGQLGSVIFNGHMHLGYWDTEPADTTYAQAAAKFTDIMVGKTRIQPGQRFCDLGCGCGEPAIALAKTKHCFVEGVTLSEFQQQDALKRAKSAGVADKTRFIVGDVLATPFPAESFDGGWFFESIFHMGHQPALLAAQRMLKSDAYLIIADLTLLPTVTEDFLVYAKDNIHADFIAAHDYPKLLNACGFELIELDNISEYVMPHLVPTIKSTIADHEQLILNTVGADIINETIKSYQLMSEHLDYVLVTARKK